MQATAQRPSDTLGTNTKSIHAGRKAARLLSPEQAGKKRAAMAGRYGLMRVAQSLLWIGSKSWKEQHRTCWCCRSANRETGTIGVFKTTDSSGASLTGLQRCGDIWSCPVCAAKVSEERRAALSAAMVAHLDGEGAAYLVTLTFPHSKHDNLFVMLERFTKARQSLQNSRTWKRVMEEAGRIGSVASLEVTISEENGWHPHVHMLIFTRREGLGEGAPVNAAGDLDSDLIAQLRRTWCNLLMKKGLAHNDDMQHMLGGTDDNKTGRAFNVRGGDKAAEYVAKFGRDERHGSSAEMTASYTKVGTVTRDGISHFTPFQLLEFAGRGDDWSACRFREYALVFKGKRAVTWSPGLRKALAASLADRSDLDDSIELRKALATLEQEELSEEDAANDDTRRPDQVEIGELQIEQYKVILRRDRLPDFMRYVAECAAAQGDIDGYVDAIRQLPKTKRGWMLKREAFGTALHDCEIEA